MRILNLFLLLFCTSVVHGQVYLNASLKRTDKENAIYYRDISEKDGKYVDSYFYMDNKPHEIIELKSIVPPIRDGKYRSYYRTGELHYEIEFRDGKKDGFMIGFFPNGTIFRKDSYQNDSLIIGKCYGKSGQDTTYHPHVVYPVFNLEGYANFRDYVTRNVVYPKNAAENGLTGKVLVEFVVDALGKVTDVAILYSDNPIFNTSSISVVNKSPDWEPGKIDGELAKVKMTIPIKYGYGF